MINSSFLNLWKHAVLLPPSEVFDYYDPQTFTDYENLVNFHELEYKISMGSNAINLQYEEYQKTLISEWGKSLRNISSYFKIVIEKTFEDWHMLHDDSDPETWASRRVDRMWYDNETGIETFEEYKEYDGENEVNYNLNMIINNPDQYGVTPINLFPKYIKYLDESNKLFFKQSFIDEVDYMGLPELVDKYYYEIREFVDNEYGDFEEYFESYLAEKDQTAYEEEVMLLYLRNRNLNEDKVREIIINKKDIQEIVEDYFEIFGDKIAENIPYEIIEKLLKIIYEKDILPRYQSQWGTRLDDSKDRVSKALNMIKEMDVERDNIYNITKVITLALNTAHTTGSMMQHFPKVKTSIYKDDNKYIYNWYEFAERNDLDDQDWEEQEKWDDEHLSGMTVMDLENISNLDTSEWNNELLQDGFLINLGGGVREFHEHTKISSSMLNLWKHANGKSYISIWIDRNSFETIEDRTHLRSHDRLAYDNLERMGFSEEESRELRNLYDKQYYNFIREIYPKVFEKGWVRVSITGNVFAIEGSYDDYNLIDKIIYNFSKHLNSDSIIVIAGEDILEDREFTYLDFLEVGSSDELLNRNKTKMQEFKTYSLKNIFKEVNSLCSKMF